MSKLPFVTGYNNDHNPILYAIDFPADGLTHQSFADECDINSILQSWNRTGELGHINQFSGSYLDLTDAVDFQESLNRISEAEDAFFNLDAKIRAKFHNDPVELLAFIHDKTTSKEDLISHGLITPKEPEATSEQLPT